MNAGPPAWPMGLVLLFVAGFAAGCGGGETATKPPDPPEPPPVILGGIADGQCGVGFVHDGVAGCDPMLPLEACAPGRMAVPGDAECHAIAPCGEGTWGDIPIDGETQHVFAAHSGASDGSAAAPWTTIGEALLAAPAGGLIAVGAGSYAEELRIEGKAVRLWGRCPSEVELVGLGVGLATIDIRPGASGTVIRGLAVVGPTIGILMSGSQDVVFEQLWVHGNDSRGIDLESALGPTSATLRGSLVEQNARTAVFSAGAQVSVEASLLRDTMAIDATGGRGIVAQRELGSGEISEIWLTGSVIERNLNAGVTISSSRLTADSSVIRDTFRGADGTGGVGLSIQQSVDGGPASVATVRTSLIRRSATVGVLVYGSEASFEAIAIREGTPDGAGAFGRGMEIQRSVPGISSTVTLRSSLLADNVDTGLFVLGSSILVEGVRIVRTAANAMGLFGDGLAATVEAGEGVATVDASFIGDNLRAGLANFGAVAALRGSDLACNDLDLIGEAYAGQAFVFDNQGGNRCGCPPEAEACAAQSAALTPPSPVDP